MSSRPSCLYILAAHAVALGVACTSPTPPPPPPPGCDTEVYPGICYSDLSGTSTPVHVVTIDKHDAPGYFEILTDPWNPPPGAPLNLTKVEDLAQNGGALVAVNGFTWSGGSGYANIPGSSVGTPEGQVIIDGQQIFPRAARIRAQDERVMGFTKNEDREVDAGMFNGDATIPARYQSAAYGTTTALMRGGACTNLAGFEKNYWSVVGYSADKIYFFTFAAELDQGPICDTLTRYGVIDAVRQDGSGAATMYVRDVGRIDPAYGVVAGARSIAYAIGYVVPL